MCIRDSPRATWLRPVNASWYGTDEPWNNLYGPPMHLSATARRFDTSPPWQLVEAGAVALELLAGLRRTDVRNYSVGLANQFRDAVGMPPSNTTIVSVRDVDPPQLSDARVRCSGRGGRARLSFYVYNDASDVEAAARALRVRAAA